MADASRKLACEPVEVIVALRQDERRSAVPYRVDDIVTNAPVPRVVADQFAVEALERHALVRLGAGRQKTGRTDDDRMLERPLDGLHLRVHPMADRATLHEDDWMMAVFTSDGR